MHKTREWGKGVERLGLAHGYPVKRIFKAPQALPVIVILMLHHVQHVVMYIHTTFHARPCSFIVPCTLLLNRYTPTPTPKYFACSVCQCSGTEYLIDLGEKVVV